MLNISLMLAKVKSELCGCIKKIIRQFITNYQHNYDDEKIAYVQSIMPVTCGDNI